MKAIRILQA